jgi:hypothetical protein
VNLAQRIRRDAGREEGGVLVMVTVWLPVIILFVILVVDVGNWFEHKRHLQTQADAAALAAAGGFRIPCVNPPILDKAADYAGHPVNYASTGLGTAYNQQVAGRQSNVYVMFNSPTYYNQSAPVDATVHTGNPCDPGVGMIDVKLTETDLPWYFGFGKVVSFINAHARVEIKPLLSASDALPVGVPDVNPRSGRVWLINESDGSTIATKPLTQTGASGGLVNWDNATDAFTNVTIPNAPVGVRVALSGSTSTTCGDPLVDCYDLTDAAHGLSYIRSWSTPSSPTYPYAKDVFLTSGSCADGYFNAGACGVGVTADLEMGPNVPVNMPGLTISATLGTANNATTYTLTNTGQACTTASPTCQRWATTTNVPIAAAGGPQSIYMRWEKRVAGTNWIKSGNTPTACTNGGNNTCNGRLNNDLPVQRSFGYVSSRSGPIQRVKVIQGGVAGANSFLAGSSHTLVVQIGVQGSLQYASSVSDPPVYLRVNGTINGNNNQSQNQSLDCDPAGGTALWYEMAYGCAPAYTINTGTSCPASPTTLWGTAQPWPCVALQTGAATNDPAKGLNTRVLGNSSPNTCPAAGQIGHNNWSLAFDPNYNLAADPRLVAVFLTPFGSFDGSGSGTVPVTQFATFYVTGWTANGQGFNNPCQGNGDDSAPDPGVIVGHFIRYVQVLNNGGGGPGFCDLSSGGGLNSGACIAVLTE